MAALEMLETFLKRWRKKCEVDGNGVQAVDEVPLSLFSRLFVTQLNFTR